MDGVRIPGGRVQPGTDVGVAAALLLRRQEHAAVSAPDERPRGPGAGGVSSARIQEAGEHEVSQYVVALPSLAWIWGQCSTRHSPPALFFSFF